MKVLIILNYYYPYVSGVSEYARILAENLVKHGHDVSVLTSNHNQLSKTEIINGVKVTRANILCKISKGTVSIEFLKLAKEMAVRGGVSRITATVHVYRKTFASVLYRKTGDVLLVSKLLGHAKPDMTVQYYLIDDIEEMQHKYNRVA